MISTVTSKGQITIPKPIRTFLNIKPSDKIDFSIENGKVILKTITTLKDFRGAVPAKEHSSIEIERREVKKEIAKNIIKEME